MASLQLRLDCAGVSLQRLCLLDRITVRSNSPLKSAICDRGAILHLRDLLRGIARETPPRIGTPISLGPGHPNNKAA